MADHKAVFSCRDCGSMNETHFEWSLWKPTEIQYQQFEITCVACRFKDIFFGADAKEMYRGMLSDEEKFTLRLMMSVLSDKERQERERTLGVEEDDYR